MRCCLRRRFVIWPRRKGWGICYLGTTLYMPSQIIDILQLPRLVMPVATLTVGWPDEHPGAGRPSAFGGCGT